jgi:hypothetical protein
MTTQTLHSLTARRDDARAFTLVALAAIAWLVAYSQLENFARALTYTLLRLEPDTRLAESVEFFLAENLFASLRNDLRHHHPADVL